MKYYFKFGSLFIVTIVMMFSTFPQNESFALEKEYSNENQVLENLDQETIDMFEEIEKYLTEDEDGNITIDEETAKSDGVNEETLNVIKIINDLENETENEEFSTFDFDIPVGNYGRYCGKGNKGGVPIDDLDRACQAHDNCFLGLTNKSAKNKKCNRNFVTALLPIVQANSELTTKGAYARGAIFIFKRNM